MLPLHRTMKSGSRDFYDDDKYEKLAHHKKCQPFKKSKKVFVLFGILSISAVYYLFCYKPSYQAIRKPESPPVITYEEEQTVITDEDLFSSPFLFTQYPPPKQLRPQDEKTAFRQKKIVEAFQHAWKGYAQDAFGIDEYQPLTHKGHNWAPGGVGLMIVDALDTIMLMNLTDEYQQARTWIQNHLDFNKDQDVNVFETTIRVLGGLLSAYHLSNNDPLYLEKAVDLGDRLLPAFNTESGIPISGITLSNGIPVGYGASSTAEATTIQLEFKYLSHLTGDMKYWNAAEKVMERMNELVMSKETGVIDGLVPIYIDPHSGNFASREIRLGSRGDSYYEYLLKQYLQTDKSEIRYREQYDHAVDGIKQHLIQHSYPNKLTYIAELMDSSRPSEIHPKMDHLVCFMGGSFMLGVTEGSFIEELDPLDKKDSEDYLLAQEITRTCYEMYNMTATGLASEIVYFNTDPTNQGLDMDIHARDRHNLLRPETLESLFLMYRMTGDEKYREWGWKIFESFEAHTKLKDGGYAALKDVTVIPPPADNRMDTFFLAETLKYLYLLFSPDDIIPLENYVLNTEAHPLPVFTPNFLK
ncbi:glycoside hydrolase [Gilbertella persicaria]|uniref:glycoside hydrolase n=1 Tax=Gilbertella persicaria TaxID=101096 RepID=UPI00221EA093|nr:glycoside hydrolase [Gilbertella persicaria]KAI8068166.1 glycoside hydrolase [Gilbertella persicaria]